MDPLKDPAVLFIPGFIFLILLELYFDWRDKLKLHDPKDSFASIGMGIGSLLIGYWVKGAAFLLYSLLYEYRLYDIPFVWWSCLLLFLGDDFTFYWHHRLSHEIRLLWAAHINHHSSVNYNLAVALRQSWTEILYKYVWWCWMPLLGFHPIWIMFMMQLSLIYQYWIHTKTIKTLGPLEWIFNTPSHHRVHHASNVRYLDKNHAGILIIWDRLFGTFQEERDDDPVKFGITKNIHTYNLIKIAFHEYGDIWKDMEKAPNFLSKLKYMFMPPGWSHDGSTQVASKLQKNLPSGQT
ncbi:MAG: sterol desaturase family protein [Bacteroidia bacterium]|nr:sterol desaturase family protein [Bacteroidia bacterium]